MVRIVTSFFALALASVANAASTDHNVDIWIDSFNNINVSGAPMLYLSPMNMMPDWAAWDNSSWLQYDFVSGSMGDIYASANTIPPGVTLEVNAMGTGGSAGYCGMTNWVILGSNGMPSGGTLISGIQNGYGCMSSLEYHARVDDFGALMPGNHFVNVMYTTSAP